MRYAIFAVIASAVLLLAAGYWLPVLLLGLAATAFAAWRHSTDRRGHRTGSSAASQAAAAAIAPADYPTAPEHEHLVQQHRGVSTEIASSLREIKRLESELKSLAFSVQPAEAACLAIGAAQACRAHLDRLGSIRFVPPLALPIVATAVTFIATDALSESPTIALKASVAMFALSLASCTLLCLLPPDAVLSRSLAKARALIQSWDDRKRCIKVHEDTLAILLDKRRPLDQQLYEIRNSVENRCRQLYAERWKELRGGDFEEYLAKVFANLGYTVERTGQSGDHGVDLVVVQAGRRVAIQAKGYVSSVSNSAVQEAYTGRKIWKCQACAVITNSRFTASAVEAASATNCTLIGEDNFENFVFGRVRFL